MILELESVSKRFGGLMAIHDISLFVEQGQIFGIIGPNGAGKTTLLKLMAGALTPDAGRIRFCGEDIIGLRSDWLCRKGISRTFQISRPFPKMTVLENVLVAAVFGGQDGNHELAYAKASAVLRFVQLPVDKDTPAERLNTAQLKRLDLARALASSPKLLLLDEVAAGLIPAELTEIIGLLLRIRDTGVTIIIVEHLMQVIMEACDRVAVLDFGEKIAEGAPAQITNNPLVAEAYLGDRYYL